MRAAITILLLIGLSFLVALFINAGVASSSGAPAPLPLWGVAAGVALFIVAIIAGHGDAEEDRKRRGGGG